MPNQDSYDPLIAPVHQSLTRPHLLNGCDRELFLVLSLVSAFIIGPLGFLAVRPAVGFAGIGMFILGRLALGYMAKVDPMARVVYQRALTYQNFYPANAPQHSVSGHWREKS